MYTKGWKAFSIKLNKMAHPRSQRRRPPHGELTKTHSNHCLKSEKDTVTLYCWQGVLPNMNPEPPAVLDHRTALCSKVNKPLLCSQPWATCALAKQDEDVRLPVYYQMEGWWSVQKGKEKKKKEQSFYNCTKCFLLWCHAWSKLA